VCGVRALVAFPDPVDEVSARLVAAGVVLQCVAILSGMTWLVAVLAYGFVARVVTGPTLSPLGQVVTRFLRPRLDLTPRPVPGPPKRFAQGIGATLSVASAVLYFGFGLPSAALIVITVILVAALFEALAGFCAGCWLFARLVRMGLVPDHVCQACADLTTRTDAATA
jgi:hypothetical protein